MRRLGSKLISNELYMVLEKSHEPVMITTAKFDEPHPKIVFCNKAFEILSGYTFNEVYNKSPRFLQGEKTDLCIFKNMKETLLLKKDFTGRVINYKKDKSEYTVDFRIFSLGNDENECFVCIFKEIKESLQNKIDREIFNLTMEKAVEHVAIINLEEKYIFVNNSYSKRCGYSKKEILGRDPSILKSGKHNDEFYLSLRKNLHRKEPFEAIFINKHKDGSLYYDKQTITPIIIDNSIQAYLVIGKDISQELQNKVHLKNLALRDQLTSLYNRNGFEEIIQKIVLNHASNDYDYTFVMVDIDFFKKINDEFGHSIGDEILKEFSSLILSSIRATDYAFRWGGEEFLIVLNTDENNAYKLIETLRKNVESHAFFSDIILTASFGLSSLIVGNHTQTIVECDEALYKAKNEGRNKVVIFNE